LTLRATALPGLVACLSAVGCAQPPLAQNKPSPPSVPSAATAWSAAHTCTFEITFKPDGPTGTGRIEYDSSGRPVEQRVELRAQRSVLSRKYDAGGRVIEEKEQRPDELIDITVSWSRDGAGKWARAERHERTAKGEDTATTYVVLARDKAGLPIRFRQTETDHGTEYVCLYDERGALTELKGTTDAKPPRSETRRYRYSAGKLVSLATSWDGDVAETRVFERDATGRLLRFIEKNSFVQHTEVFTYDAQGRVALMEGRSNDDPPTSLGFRYGPECRPTDKRLQPAEIVEEWVTPQSD
jgi:hypothetical protein